MAIPMQFWTAEVWHRFDEGAYLVWNMTGRVKVRATRTSGVNTVLSGLFFGPRQ
jgi:hypothetical protein